MQLGPVALNIPQVLRHSLADGYGLGEGVAGNLGDFVNEMAQGDQAGWSARPAGKGEDLLDHLRASLGAGRDQVQELSLLRLVVTVLAQQLRTHEDRHEGVIQVVRDATGEGAQALHSLRAKELFFELFSVRNVRVYREHTFGLALLVAHE